MAANARPANRDGFVPAMDAAAWLWRAFPQAGTPGVGRYAAESHSARTGTLSAMKGRRTVRRGLKAMRGPTYREAARYGPGECRGTHVSGLASVLDGSPLQR
jgi:hypothetical protein